jgi:hypothetical protein
LRRHRYETAFIERNVTGFYPVELVDIPGGKEKGFSLLAQDKDGALMKRTYGFSGYHVRLISKVPVTRKEGLSTSEPAVVSSSTPASTAAPAGWWRRVASWPRRWFAR